MRKIEEQQKQEYRKGNTPMQLHNASGKFDQLNNDFKV